MQNFCSSLDWRRAGVQAGLALLFAYGGTRAGFAGEGVFNNGYGARAMGLGGADVATAEGPFSALTTNPAALSLLTDPTLDVSFTGVVPNGDFTNRFGSSGPLDNHFDLGPALAFGLPIGHTPVHFGIAGFPAAGLSAHWHYEDTPGGLGGTTSYGFQENTSRVTLWRIDGGISIQVSRWCSIGADLGPAYNENILKTPYVFQSQPVLHGLKTSLDLETHGWGLDGGAGVQFRVNDAVQIGISYQSATPVRSHGTATGNAGAQILALGPAFAGVRRDFAYDAEVDTEFPQRVIGGVSWKICPKWRLALQLDWVNWSNSFDMLPVKLMRGNNTNINTLVGANSFEDDVPLQWRDQVVYRAGVEYSLDDAWRLRLGYAYGRSPVPNGTLTPLTAVIPEHTLTAGVGYCWKWLRVDLAYQWDLPATRHIDQSGLLDGEYSGSSTSVSIHWVGLTTSVRF